MEQAGKEMKTIKKNQVKIPEWIYAISENNSWMGLTVVGHWKRKIN